MSYELVVSDASDPPIDFFNLPHTVRILEESPRLGCTKGFNRAFREARGEWLIWLNDDVEVAPGYAEAAIRFMEEHPEIGLGALYYSDPTHIGFKVNSCVFGMLYANFGIIRRKLGEQVGFFDEDILMYGCDNSLTYRVLLAGKGVAGIPSSRVVHHSVNDAERRNNNDLPFRIAQAELLKAKYGPRLSEMRAVYEATRTVLV